MPLDSIIARLTEVDDSLQLEELVDVHPAGFRVVPDQLIRVCLLLKEDEHFYFDMLSAITAVDLGIETGRMELIYQLYSLTQEVSLTLKTTIDRAKPVADSVAGIWRAADWHEREAFDLFGIQFRNHPDLRRILLPADWEGFPLRKDYQEQEKYHGIHVTYDRED